MTDIVLRPYQERAIEEIRAKVAAGARRVLVVSPVGSGKCVTPDTLVWSRGLRAFGEVYGQDRIEGPHGAAAVSGWYEDGLRDGYRVTLQCGSQINGTPAHRIWVRSEDGFEGWKYIGELAGGDYVALARGQADFGDESMDTEEAYTLGLAIADGCIIESTGTFRIDKQLPVLHRVAPVVERWLGRPPKIHEVSSYHAFLAAYGDFRRFFADRFGIDWQYSERREVPRCIRSGTREVVASFLRGYFDGDGYCGLNVAVSSASEPLARQVHALLLGLGVFAKLRYKETPRLPAHIVEVRDVGAFDREVGLTTYGLKKDTAYARLLARPRNTNVDVIPGVAELLRRASRLVEGRGTRGHPWYRGADEYVRRVRRPSYPSLAKLAVHVPASPERDELVRLLVEHRAWSRVVCLQESRRHRIDCEVPEGHAFVGNGIINHNTTIAGAVTKSAVGHGKRSLFIAHRRELIQQAYDRFLAMGIPEAQVGIIMAGDPRRRPGAMVQVASVDTLRARAKPAADVVIVDECHRAVCRSYRAIAAAYPDAVHLGFTATGFRANGDTLGDDYGALVLVATPRALIADGNLVEPRIFTVPLEKRPDLRGVRVRRGDYDEKQLADAMNKNALVGDIVEHWRSHARGVRTLAFAVSVAHSKHIVEKFVGAGIAAEHLDGTSPPEVRDATMRRLREGRTLVVGSVALFSEGTDVPAVKCAILARPTKSLGLYLQQAGRVMRPWKGQRAVILDHAGCALEHGLPQADREVTLEPNKRRAKGKSGEAPVKTCEECYAVIPASSATCPECDFAFEVREAMPREERGALVEVTPEIAAAIERRRRPESADEKRDYLRELIATETSAAWARARYHAELREAPPR